ncbi:MAG: hypothetical protein U1D30_18400 [Planctomycetota bacterium]
MSRFAPTLFWCLLANTALADMVTGPVQGSSANGGNNHWYQLVMPDAPSNNYTWGASLSCWPGIQRYTASLPTSSPSPPRTKTTSFLTISPASSRLGSMGPKSSATQYGSD